MTLYTTQWRDRIRPGVVASAQVIVPTIIERFDPRSVVDVGCGEGWFVNEFRDADVFATGVDGEWAQPDQAIDLSSPPYPDVGMYDLALCLEVAEHIPAKDADALVAWLCSLAPITVFSAAIPKQGGTGHVNEQWPAYWVDLFAKHGRIGSGDLRQQLWTDDRVEVWYRQNLLVFADTPAHLNGLVPGCPALVHPDMWSLYRR